MRACPTMASMPPLRVRSGADINLADAFGLPGCPLCRERRRTEAAYLESILSESVNDIPFRQAFDEARGFCARHSRAVLDADRARSGSLGASILLWATLVARMRDVRAATTARGWARSRRVAEARRPPDCPACDRVATADERSVETVVRLAADDAWAEAAATAPFCLAHVLALMDVRPSVPSWAAVEARQVARLEALQGRLAAFAHASAHDRRHLQTDDQRASVDEAADVLGGARPGPEGAAVSGVAPGSRDGAAAVLLTGVYGTGKTTLAIELADRLGDVDVPAAAIDLDWLGWYDAPTGWDEHDDPRLTLEHLAQMASRYLDVGVRRLIIAGTIPAATRERYAASVGVPLTVVRLEVGADALRRRLATDPNGSRQDDLATALADLEAGTRDDGADWTVDADRPPATLATEVLERLGWS
jgi:predicted kinase